MNNSTLFKLLKTIWLSPQLRNILLLSFIITLLFPLYHTLVTQPQYNNLIIQFIEDDASRVGKHLSHPLINSNKQLQRGTLPSGFEQMLKEVKNDFRLEKVKLFGQTGEVIYSTNEEDIGKINKHDYFHNVVATGQAYSKLVQKSHSTAEGRIVDRDVVESYSPIMNGDKFLGAFELYYDITQRKLSLDKLLSNSTLQMIFMALILIVALLIVQIRSATIVRSRDEALQALEKSENRFRHMTSSAQDAIIEMDCMGRVAFWNQAAERIFGISSDEAMAQDLHRLIAPQRFQVEFRNHYEAFQKSGVGRLIGNSSEIVGIRKDGKEIPIEVSIAALDSEDGFRAIGIIRDISKRKEAERQLKLGSSIIVHALQGIIVTDAIARIQLVNPAFLKITGFSQKEVLGKNPSILASGRHDSQFYKQMWHQLHETGFWEGEIWNRKLDGGIYPEWLSLNVIRDSENKITNYVGMFSDISTLKEAEEELERLAFYDPLTGISNRMLFRERLNQAIKEGKRQTTIKHALLYLDLDYFKQVNDTHGHEIGDLLLQEAAERMSETVREVDTVARIGGDEFSIILREITDTKICEKIADNIISTLAKPFYLKGIECRIGTSIGIAIYPDNGVSVDELVKSSDNAMYIAKKNGRNRYQFAGD
ncbi:MAG: diguanylate cyclase [gamma proteobacterium symbiont of Taylorina sp.]|nr:diguanylate cyclase [gamma proteobacterium symbiont of Taylorina sp.]